TPIVFFASVAYAITAHDAFDINRLLRRTALYFALTLVITGTYAAILVVASLFVPTGNLVASVGFQIPVFVLFGLLFQPVRNRLQTVIDETFFRREVDYRRAVSDVSAALTSVLDLGEIFDRVGETVTRSFALESFAAVLWVEDQTRIWRYRKQTGRTVEERSPQPFAVLRERLRASADRPLGLVDYETGREADPVLSADLGRDGPALAVPISARQTVLGAFLRGRKRSGLPFSRDDLDVLGTLSAQSAIAIQNALSYRSLQELATSLEDRVRERTSELERSNAELGRKHDEVERSREAVS